MGNNGFLYFNSDMTGAPQIENLQFSIRDIFLACTSVGFGKSKISNINGRYLTFNKGYSVFDHCVYIVESDGHKQRVKAKQIDINTIEIDEELSIETNENSIFYPSITEQKVIDGIFTDNRVAIELSDSHFLGIGSLSDNKSVYIGATKGSTVIQDIKINGKWSLLIGKNGAYFKYETKNKFNLKSIAVCSAGAAYDNTRLYDGTEFSGAFDESSRAHTFNYGLVTDDVLLNPFAGVIKNYNYIGATFLPVVSNVTGGELVGYLASSGNLNSEKNKDTFIYNAQEVICIMNYENRFVAIAL